jgi:glycine/D-amino acid oxidase-like deaminating enzyme
MRALRPAAAAVPRLRVGVAGGGIVGASIAMRLARSGATVWLFEKAAPAQGATRNSFAWVSAFVDDPHYRTIRLESIAAYHALDRALWDGVGRISRLGERCGGGGHRTRHRAPARGLVLPGQAEGLRGSS